MPLLPYPLARPFLFGMDPEAAHDLTRAIGSNATRHGQQDRRQPILGDYASGVSHAILSAAISSRAIVR
jgi:dihydroorotate dehydrogenase